MLQILINDKWTPIENRTNYYIQLNYDGFHELSFDISKYDSLFNLLQNETVVKNEDNQFLIKKINVRSSAATFTCELDMDEWKKGTPIYDTSLDSRFQTKTLGEMLEIIKPNGWTIVNAGIRNYRRTPELQDVFPYDILVSLMDTFSIVYDIDVLKKTLRVIDPEAYELDGLYITPELNLNSISWTGDSEEFCTRLYCYGAIDEGTEKRLTFASINGGKEYVEDHSYTDKTIAMVWSDERYTVAENLLEDAKEKLKKISVPTLSYEVTVNDLAKQNEKYSFLNFGLYRKVVTIINESFSIVQNIVTYKQFYDDPSKNVVTLSNEVQKFTSKISNILGSDIKNTTTEGTFLEQMQRKTQIIMNEFMTKGYRYETENETYYLDKLPKEEAKYVLRINLGGIAFSSQGWQGPYITAWTIDGRFNAEFIMTGILSDKNGNFYLDMDKGELVMKNGTFTGEVNTSKGNIAGWIISKDRITSPTEGTSYSYISPNGFYSRNNINNDFYGMSNISEGALESSYYQNSKIAYKIRTALGIISFYQPDSNGDLTEIGEISCLNKDTLRIASGRYLSFAGASSEGKPTTLLQYFRESSGEDRSILRPEDSGGSYLGSAGYRFNTLFCNTVNESSDLKEKEVIKDFDFKNKEFIMGLEPIAYRRTDESSGGKRIHMGFGAQPLSKLIKDIDLGDMSIVQASNIRDKELVTEIDENGNEVKKYKVVEKPYYGEEIDDKYLSWSIKYNEFICQIVLMLQNHEREKEDLKKEIKSLKKEIEKLKEE